jgi:hypothetical protein
MKTLLHNLKQLLIALDQLANVLIGLVCGYQSWSDETLSAKAYRLELERGRTWARKIIDTLFFWDKNHCKESYESEVLKRQLPPSMR